MEEKKFELTQLETEDLNDNIFLQHILYDNYANYDEGTNFEVLYDVLNKHILNMSILFKTKN